jgi:hypothetical protein
MNECEFLALLFYHIPQGMASYFALFLRFFLLFYPALNVLPQSGQNHLPFIIFFPK